MEHEIDGCLFCHRSGEHNFRRDRTWLDECEACLERFEEEVKEGSFCAHCWDCVAHDGECQLTNGPLN